MKNLVKGLLLFFLLTGCKGNDKRQPDAERDMQMEKFKNEKATEILKETIKAHGGDLYNTAHYKFVFRDKEYTFHNGGGYTYTLVGKDSVGNGIVDSLNNGDFKRSINNSPVELSSKDSSKYSNALNSVIYFATLPHKLSDKAVKPTYLGETVIKGEDYDVLKITFQAKGGGQDHEDEFCYWINKNSHYINYLAYSYQTNDGGVRFRSAYNPRTIDGIRFQDYINWEAPVGTPLQQLPELYEKGLLKELSRIETNAIQNLGPSTSEE